MAATANHNEHRSYFAAAAVVMIIAGLLIPKAADSSFDRAALVWLTGCIVSGVIGSNIRPVSFLGGARFSVIFGALLCASLVVYYYLQWLVGRMLNIGSDKVLIYFYGGLIDFADPKMLPLAGQLLLVLWVVTAIVITFAIVSGRMLNAAAISLYDFGPDGLNRVHKIILTVMGIVASIIALWAAFG